MPVAVARVVLALRKKLGCLCRPGVPAQALSPARRPTRTRALQDWNSESGCSRLGYWSWRHWLWQSSGTGRALALCAAPPLFVGWVVLVLHDWKTAVFVGASVAVVLISIKATMNHFARKEHERKREKEKIQRAKALEDAQRERGISPPHWPWER